MPSFFNSPINVGTLPATPIQNYPQIDPEDAQHAANVFGQFVQNKQQQAQPNLVQQILQNRFQPEPQDTANSIMTTAQSFLAPQMFKPTTPQEVMAERYKSELFPYTSMLDAQSKMQTNAMNSAGGATGVLADRLIAENAGNPNGPRNLTQALTLMRGGFNQGYTFDENGNAVAVAGLPAALGAIAQGKQTGQNISDLQYKPQIAGGEAQAKTNVELANAARIEAEKAAGKTTGERTSELRANLAKMPQLQATVQKLRELGKTATYTAAGVATNTGRRELGLPVGPGAVARAEYISMVDNQILPLLRDTFGAQFTENEGKSLKITLGDPNKSPEEKDAVLRSFIEQKMLTVQSLKREVGMGGGAIPNPPSPDQLPTNVGGTGVTHRWNSAIGQLEPAQ